MTDVRAASEGSGPTSPHLVDQQFGAAPGGSRPRELIAEVAPGETLVRTRRGSRAKQRKRNFALENAFAGQRAAPNWITSAYWMNDDAPPITELVAKLVVPTAPATGTNQIIYVFVALQDYPVSLILQPVLQWNLPDAAPARWSISSWYVESSGEARRTPPVAVSPGDPLTAYVRLTREQGGRFDYACGFQGHHASEMAIARLPAMKLAVGVLEAYRVERCSDYPATSPVRLDQVSVRTREGAVIPNWRVNDRVIDCGQRTVVSNHAGSSSIHLHCR